MFKIIISILIIIIILNILKNKRSKIKLSKKKYDKIHKFIKHKKLKSDHIHKLIQNKQLEPEHIHKLIQNKQLEPTHIDVLIKQKQLEPTHIDVLVKQKQLETNHIIDLVKSKQILNDHIDKLIEDKHIDQYKVKELINNEDLIHNYIKELKDKHNINIDTREIVKLVKEGNIDDHKQLHEKIISVINNQLKENKKTSQTTLQKDEKIIIKHPYHNEVNDVYNLIDVEYKKKIDKYKDPDYINYLYKNNKLDTIKDNHDKYINNIHDIIKNKDIYDNDKYKEHKFKDDKNIDVINIIDKHKNNIKEKIKDKDDNYKKVNVDNAKKLVEFQNKIFEMKKKSEEEIKKLVIDNSDYKNYFVSTLNEYNKHLKSILDNTLLLISNVQKKYMKNIENFDNNNFNFADLEIKEIIDNAYKQIEIEKEYYLKSIKSYKNPVNIDSEKNKKIAVVLSEENADIISKIKIDYDNLLNKEIKTLIDKFNDEINKYKLSLNKDDLKKLDHYLLTTNYLDKDLIKIKDNNKINRDYIQYINNREKLMKIYTSILSKYNIIKDLMNLEYKNYMKKLMSFIDDIYKSDIEISNNKIDNELKENTNKIYEQIDTVLKNNKSFNNLSNEYKLIYLNKLKDIDTTYITDLKYISNNYKDNLIVESMKLGDVDINKMYLINDNINSHLDIADHYLHVYLNLLKNKNVLGIKPEEFNSNILMNKHILVIELEKIIHDKDILKDILESEKIDNKLEVIQSKYRKDYDIYKKYNEIYDKYSKVFNKIDNRNIKKLNDMVNDILKPLNEKVDKIYNLIKKEFDIMLEKIIGLSNDKLKSEIDKFLEIITKETENMSLKVKQNIESFKRSINKLIEESKGNLEYFTKETKKALKHLKDKLDNKSENLTDKIEHGLEHDIEINMEIKTEKDAEKAMKLAIEKAVKEASQKAAKDTIQKLGPDTSKQLLTQLVRDASNKAAREAAEKAAQKFINKISTDITDISIVDAAKKAASDLTNLTAEKALIYAEKAASKAADIAQKAKKIADLIEKLKNSPAEMIVLIITTILQSVLHLEDDEFDQCIKSYSFDDLPGWMKTIISGIPYLSDFFNLIGDKLCFIGGCPDGTVNEAGLCYKACDPGFKSDGATMCYKQYSDFSSGTITSITKSIKMNTGVPLSTCSNGYEKNGALCYPQCNQGYYGNGPVCWGSCGNNIDEGALCRERCRDGYYDVGGVCWSACPDPYYSSGAMCTTGLHIYGKGCCCHGYLSCGRYGDCSWESACCGCGGGYTDDGCTCRRDDSYWKSSYVPRTYAKPSYGRGAGNPLQCAQGLNNIAGLCYKNCPYGYTMQSLGLCSQICPSGTKDFGVGCIREAYNRGVGKIPLTIRLKPRKK